MWRYINYLWEWSVSQYWCRLNSLSNIGLMAFTLINLITKKGFYIFFNPYNIILLDFYRKLPVVTYSELLE